MGFPFLKHPWGGGGPRERGKKGSLGRTQPGGTSRAPMCFIYGGATVLVVKGPCIFF